MQDAVSINLTTITVPRKKEVTTTVLLPVNHSIDDVSSPKKDCSEPVSLPAAQKYKLIPRYIFNAKNLKIEFFNAIKDKDLNLVNALLAENPNLAFASIRADMLGKKGESEYITAYRYAYLEGNMRISMRIFKSIGEINARAQAKTWNGICDDETFNKLQVQSTPLRRRVS